MTKTKIKKETGVSTCPRCNSAAEGHQEHICNYRLVTQRNALRVAVIDLLQLIEVTPENEERVANAYAAVDDIEAVPRTVVAFRRKLRLAALREALVKNDKDRVAELVHKQIP